jgi:hypothetical protein
VITDSDLKALKGASDKEYRITQIFFGGIVLFLLFIALSNFLLALDYAKSMGHDFYATLAMWNTETELWKHYLGFEVESIHRFSLCILDIGVALLIMIYSVLMSSTRKRNKRILAALNKI